MITTKLTNLRQAVRIVSHCSPTRTTLPSLNGVLFDYKASKLTVRCSDLESFSESSCEASGEGELAFGVPASLLIHFLSGCYAEDVSVEVDKQATFVCGSRRTVLNIVPPSEFPDTLAVDGKSFEVNAGELLRKLGKVVPCAEDNNPAHPVLESVLFEFTQDGLTLLSTNGKILGFCTMLVYSTGQIAVPRRAILNLLKMLPGVEGELAVTHNENAVKFSTPQWNLSGTLLAVEFPSWRQIVSENELKITVSRESLIDAVKQSIPYGESGFTRLELHAKDDKLSVRSGIGNSFVAELDCKSDDISLAVNAKLFLILISALEGDAVVIECSNQTGKQIVIRENDFTGAMMPLRMEQI